ncbi:MULTISPECIES: ABC transporter ATP-binding protein [Streptomyces]|uniref:ABC transporter ATP-binding protein n=1 Tax=Streptomyces doudnae TaxID=3075536 RepID=A0ABD5EIJ4_9ACTN|nr:MULTISPECIES: ABC transporter ATP-binding protein [unclassified Streptomyces]MDT0434491.1 ABC transporter ATP-binding protein [Streptomyces sp. DSM 41981]MYQ63001.1 ATP-binding cassette domain-containing protein [Streptomyces sp. SID4950]SCD48610.1 oligopeptide/dipeptide ABC transporter, ATP-binding protein, C-terminal domain-containing protein [Streptomyces sp. SolWspMP-5a-2]
MSTLTKIEGEPVPAGPESFLSVRDLQVTFATEDGPVKAVDGLSFDVRRGSTLGIVGESGSGKSVTNLTILGLHNPRTTTVDGEILLEGKELITTPEKEMEKLRGNRMAMIFQDPLTALSPFYTVGWQIAEPFQKHTGASKKEAWQRAVDMLEKVGIPNPKERAKDYPHQFSGGMRQRAMIAMALVCDPDLLIADEPTTALDVTVQAQILDLLKDLQQEFGSAIVFITHDLGVIADVADDIMVMYAGRAVERGTVDEVLRSAQHPYTWGLLNSMPRLDSDLSLPLEPIPGTPPSLLSPPSGCRFHPRCTFRDRVGGSRCVEEVPALGQGRSSACHLTAEQKRTIYLDEIRPGLG